MTAIQKCIILHAKEHGKLQDAINNWLENGYDISRSSFQVSDQGYSLLVIYTETSKEKDSK